MGSRYQILGPYEFEIQRSRRAQGIAASDRLIVATDACLGSTSTDASGCVLSVQQEREAHKFERAFVGTICKDFSVSW